LNVAKLEYEILIQYNLSISCDELFTINQHKFLISCFFCSVFRKTKFVANVHEKVHPLSFFIHIFIHKYHSYVTCGKIFFHVTKYFILGVIEYFLKDLVLLPCSCSPTHVHVQRLMK